MAREIRRGNKYDGIILDPPAFGRGAKKDWKIERDLPDLMELVAKLLTPEPRFVILTCHAPQHFFRGNFGATPATTPRFQRKKKPNDSTLKFRQKTETRSPLALARVFAIKGGTKSDIVPKFSAEFFWASNTPKNHLFLFVLSVYFVFQ